MSTVENGGTTLSSNSPREKKMDEQANSWIRRTNFSHTVCHRLDSSRLATIPSAIRAEKASSSSSSSSSGLKSRPIVNSSSFSSLELKQVQSSSRQIKPKNPVASKQRSLSPHAETNLSETFREAKYERRRFSTPEPRRAVSDRGFVGHKRFPNSRSSSSARSSNASPLQQLKSASAGGGGRSRKYFDSKGGRVSAVEEADGWTVDMSKLFLGSKFAHGAHSRLYHGMYDGAAVAVKIISLPGDHEVGGTGGLTAARLEREYVSEVTLLARLRHDNVIKLVAACRNTPIYCVITEYLPEGSLRAYLHRREREPLPYGKVIAYALDIARGMEFVHSQGVIHRDLKPENILIDKDFRMKIADFGTACDEGCRDSVADDPGTYRWMAPEMIRHRPYGRKVDVYSFGLILWEMVAGTIPYEDMNPIQAAFAVVNKNLRPAIPKNCPPAMRALIEQCWSLQPEKRPEFWQVVKVLEQFVDSFARNGTLTLVHNPCCQDHKKGLRHWIQKLGPMHPHSTTPVPKPRFI